MRLSSFLCCYYSVESISFLLYVMFEEVDCELYEGDAPSKFWKARLLPLDSQLDAGNLHNTNILSLSNGIILVINSRALIVQHDKLEFIPLKNKAKQN